MALQLTKKSRSHFDSRLENKQSERLGRQANANYKFVIYTKKEPRVDLTKSYKIIRRVNTRGENKEKK